MVLFFFISNFWREKKAYFYASYSRIFNSNRSFRLELLPSQESVASDSPVESEHKMLQATQN